MHAGMARTVAGYLTPMSRTVSSSRVLILLLPIALLVAGLAWWKLRTGPDVALLGDSITVVSNDQIKEALGRAYTPDIAAVLGITAGEMIPAAQKAAQRNPEQVVIELGSNDVLKKDPLDQAAQHLRDLVAQFPKAKCVHLVTINSHMTDAGKPVAPRAGLLNAAIVQIKASDTRIDLIDWNAAVSDAMAAHGGKETLTSDTVHPNGDGAKVLATLIRAGLDRCPK